MVAECPLFAGVPDDAVKGVQAKTTVQDPLDTGRVVFRRGDDAREMFFVVSGEVEIRAESGACLMTVAEGGYFGEIGALMTGNRTADAVVSQGPCELAVLRRVDLDAASTQHGFRDKVLSNGQQLPRVRTWFINRLPLFTRCAGESGFLSRVANALQVRTAGSGEVVVREGDPGREMFFIFEGAVEVHRGGRNVARMSAPHFFGEVALLYSEPRSATVTCASRCRFYVLEREALHEILQAFPGAIGAIYSTAQEANSLKAHFIHKIPLFKSKAHDEEFVANMTMALESSSAKPGEYLMRQGNASDGRMFAIAHGRAEVLKVKRAGDPASIVATLGPGDFIGEVALLLDTPRTASVVARSHCHFYTLRRDAFESLAVVYQDWWQELMAEDGAVMKQLKSMGVKIGAASTTQTHGLTLPQLEGKSVSSMLLEAEASAPSDSSTIPEGRLCVVCRTEEKCMLSVPCGHISACETCHGSLAACPVCRARIQSGMKAFF